MVAAHQKHHFLVSCPRTGLTVAGAIGCLLSGCARLGGWWDEFPLACLVDPSPDGSWRVSPFFGDAGDRIADTLSCEGEVGVGDLLVVLGSVATASRVLLVAIRERPPESDEDLTLGVEDRFGVFLHPERQIPRHLVAG